MKKIVLALMLLLLPICSVSATNYKNINNAFDLVSDMGAGWNLGNSLDAMNKGKGYTYDTETLWSNPVTTKELIDYVKSLGFTSIRIPVSYYNHIDSNGNIDSKWLDRVEEVINYALANDMYVITNVHHDAGMDRQYNWIYSDVSTYNEDKNNLMNLWKQIATRLNKYDNRVLFEAHNEIMNRDSNWDWSSQTDDFKLVHDIDQEWINYIRSTGGNNSKRFLVLSTWGASSDYMQIECLMNKSFNDTISNHLIIEVHDYKTDISSINKVMDMINNYSKKYNIPFIIGETGTSAWSDSKFRESIASSFSTKAKTYGIGLFVWDDNGDYRLVNRSNRSVDQMNVVDAYVNPFKVSTPKPSPTTTIPTTTRKESTTTTSKKVLPSSTTTTVNIPNSTTIVTNSTQTQIMPTVSSSVSTSNNYIKSFDQIIKDPNVRYEDKVVANIPYTENNESIFTKLVGILMILTNISYLSKIIKE